MLFLLHPFTNRFFFRGSSSFRETVSLRGHRVLEQTMEAIGLFWYRLAWVGLVGGWFCLLGGIWLVVFFTV